MSPVRHNIALVYKMRKEFPESAEMYSKAADDWAKATEVESLLERKLAKQITDAPAG